MEKEIPQSRQVHLRRNAQASHEKRRSRTTPDPQRNHRLCQRTDGNPLAGIQTPHEPEHHGSQPLRQTPGPKDPDHRRRPQEQIKKGRGNDKTRSAANTCLPRRGRGTAERGG